MEILILHHIEPMWEKSFDRDILIPKSIQHIKNNNYDKIILTTLEHSGGYEELKQFIDTEEEYSYAWENPEENKEWYKDNKIEKKDIIECSSPHQFAYLYDWIKELKGHNVFLAGGKDDECLRDLQESLDYLKINYKRVEELIY